MKIFKKLSAVIFACALLAATALCLFFGLGAQKTYAIEVPVPPRVYDAEYGFAYTAFEVTYDIRADRTMDVTYDLGVFYGGYLSTGLLFDIPVNAGDRVRNLSAYELDKIGGEESHLMYKVKNEETNLVTVDMGDYSRKYGQTRFYRIKFEYAITRPAKDEKNQIYLNAIGFGHQADMYNVKVTLNLPDGFIGARTKCVLGYSGTENPHDFTVNGNTVTLTEDKMLYGNGVTFTLPFEEGVLSTKPDMTPYYIVIAACAVLALLFAAKFLLFNKDGLAPVTNVEAPNEMDPLVMGKLIDNKVDKSDVTSLIYYWANKGYLKINMQYEYDIELIRIVRELPQNSPKYQKRMYTRLFQSGDIVKINSLTNSFYSTVDAVTKEVNAANSKLYDKKSMGFAVLFALAGALLMGLTPIILAITKIHRTFFPIAPLLMIVPAFVIFGLALTVRYNRLKVSKSKLALMYLGVAALAAIFTVIYLIFVPSYIVEILPKLMLCAVGFGIVMLSSTLISRTDEYREKLNNIVGFRDFILSVEKDKLEAMLEGNPEFYYQVLPYAIVLGVSDIWENKFAALTVAPPSWTTAGYHNRMFNFMVFNAAMRNVNRNMTNTFVSRPSSGSYSGGGHGGSFGGHGGGGHGGGGSRGR